jgi:hypothetical protein
MTRTHTTPISFRISERAFQRLKMLAGHHRLSVRTLGARLAERAIEEASMPASSPGANRDPLDELTLYRAIYATKLLELALQKNPPGINEAKEAARAEAELICHPERETTKAREEREKRELLARITGNEKL